MSKKYSYEALAEALKRNGACEIGVQGSLSTMNPDREPLTLEEWWTRASTYDRKYAMTLVFGKHAGYLEECWCQTAEAKNLVCSATLPEKVKQAWEEHLARVTGGDSEVNIHDQ